MRRAAWSAVTIAVFTVAVHPLAAQQTEGAAAAHNITVRVVAWPPSIPGGRSDWVMRIPSISDLAEDAFVDNHCFHVAGLEEKEERRLLRLDIIAAERRRGVDVNVVVWLDPKDFQLRHATYTLTKPPPQVRGLLHSASRVTYREVIPFVPVIELTVAENTVQEGRTRTTTKVLVERQRIERVLFKGARPEGLALDSLP